MGLVSLLNAFAVNAFAMAMARLPGHTGRRADSACARAFSHAWPARTLVNIARRQVTVTGAARVPVQRLFLFVAMWPCPPAGDAPHRYLFTVHALDVEKLDVPEGCTAAFIGFNLHAHLLGRTSLSARYGR
jgi:phosphatidylethanolamine-binding protein (PEBP) family uncharacterized protein